MRLHQNICFEDILVLFYNKLCGSKNKPHGQISLKHLVYSRRHSFDWIFMKLHQNVCFDVFSVTGSSIGCVCSKSRSARQIILKPFVHIRSNGFCLIFYKTAQKDCGHPEGPAHW